MLSRTLLLCLFVCVTLTGCDCKQSNPNTTLEKEIKTGEFEERLSTMKPREAEYTRLYARLEIISKRCSSYETEVQAIHGMIQILQLLEMRDAHTSTPQ